MNQFQYVRARSTSEALTASGKPHAAFLAGGTTMVDLMKLGVERPAELVDINSLPLTQIEALPDGGLRIGAMARNSDVAHHDLVRSGYPVLSEALLSGASPQLRNMATVGGNIMQRTRCYYFRDLSFACNKRAPGSGCPALDGYNRMHAILGTSDKCIATHPSDMNVALIALDAVIHVQGPKGERAIPFEQFHLEPGNTPERETVLQPGELITSVQLPASPFAARSHYLKVRDRASYEFALASVAVALEITGDRIGAVRLAVGGVATRPWRAHGVEKILAGQPPTDELYARAAKASIEGAQPHGENAFKVELLQRAVTKALRTVVGTGAKA